MRAEWSPGLLLHSAPRRTLPRGTPLALALVLLVASPLLSGCLFPPVTSAGAGEEEDPLGVFGLAEGETAYRLRRASQERNGSFETTVFVGDEGSVGQGPSTLIFSMPPELRRFKIRLDWTDQCQQAPLGPDVPQVDCSAQQSPSAHDLDFTAKLVIDNETSEEIWRGAREGGEFGSPDRPAELPSEPEDDIQRGVETDLVVNVWAETSRGLNYTMQVEYEHLVPLMPL